MDAFGINRTYLLSQIGFCFGIGLTVALIAVVAKSNRSSKFHRTFLGVMTAWVVLYSWAFSLAWTTIFILSVNGLVSGFDLAFNLQNRSMPISMPTLILSVLLIVYYLVHAANAPFLSPKQRERYVLGLLFLPFFVMPVYYLRFIKNEKPVSISA